MFVEIMSAAVATEKDVGEWFKNLCVHEEDNLLGPSVEKRSNEDYPQGTALMQLISIIPRGKNNEQDRCKCSVPESTFGRLDWRKG